jgi:solute:Na+ symporter, SSS family
VNFETTDIIVFAGYIIFMMGFGIWISGRKNTDDDVQDYFLAGKALPWWAVGGSLIASNISAEQFIGMSGSGYVVGLAIASYELMGAATLLIIAKYFLPVFINKGIYTMPQFLEQRFDNRVKSGLAVFWVLLFVFVNITSVLYLGGLAMETILGIKLFYGVIGLAIYAASFSIFGGLKAVVWTDVMQVIVLIFGGLLTTYMVLDAFSDGGGLLIGFKQLYNTVPEKFDLILEKSNPEYINLPGIGVLIGGMWIANLYYWGTNQYIIQRALAAKSIKEAQVGVAFAAFMKVILPVIVVVPGIVAFALHADIAKPDQAYPWLLSNYVTVGFKGLAVAALVAAIGSSLSSMVNSTSTIFTLDIYNQLHRKPATELDLVKVGKITAAASLVIGVIIAPLLGNLDQAFQYIQEYTGFISPGVVAIFLFGMFWQRTTTNAALTVVLLAIPLSAGLKYWFGTVPFMDRMGISFILLSAILVLISFFDKQPQKADELHISKDTFSTSNIFNILSIAILGLLAVIYIVFW